MARTIGEIKKEATGHFIANETVIGLYGLDTAKDFEAQFSRASIESILFYIVSVGIWAVETLFDTHKAEMAGLMAQMKPHRLRWYADKALAFQWGRALATDSDSYDNSGATDAQVLAEKVVKYAAAIETQGSIQIRVATDGTGGRGPLTGEQATALGGYLKEIKDAGVQVALVNAAPNSFAASIDIYYDPMVLGATLGSLANGGTPVRDAVANFIANLPFNGEYRNASLIDCLQAIPGVTVPELLWSRIDGLPVLAKAVPTSGYMKIYTDTDLQLNPIAYATVSN